MKIVRFTRNLKKGLIIAEFDVESSDFVQGRVLMNDGKAYEINVDEHGEAIAMAVLYGKQAYISTPIQHHSE